MWIYVCKHAYIHMNVEESCQAKIKTETKKKNKSTNQIKKILNNFSTKIKFMENQPWIRLHGSVGLLVPDSILPTGDIHQGGYTIKGRQRQASSRSYVNKQPTKQPASHWLFRIRSQPYQYYFGGLVEANWMRCIHSFIHSLPTSTSSHDLWK